MNYKKIYDQIISNRISNSPVHCYVELHHIVPRSLGGADSTDNLVRLTAREHFVCHLLLVKMHKNSANDGAKMLRAFIMMHSKSPNQHRYFPSRMYAKLREEFAKLQSISQNGENNSQFGTKWVTNVVTGEIKKVSADEELDNNWTNGRKQFSFCKCCKTQYMKVNNTIFCSIDCKTIYEKEIKSERMKTANPMQNPEVAAKNSRSNTGKKRKGYVRTKEHRNAISTALKGKGIGTHKKSICPHCGKSGGERAMKRHHFDNCKVIPGG